MAAGFPFKCCIVNTWVTALLLLLLLLQLLLQLDREFGIGHWYWCPAPWKGRPSTKAARTGGRRRCGRSRRRYFCCWEFESICVCAATDSSTCPPQRRCPGERQRVHLRRLRTQRRRTARSVQGCATDGRVVALNAPLLVYSSRCEESKAVCNQPLVSYRPLADRNIITSLPTGASRRPSRS